MHSPKRNTVTQIAEIVLQKNTKNSKENMKSQPQKFKTQPNHVHVNNKKMEL